MKLIDNNVNSLNESVIKIQDRIKEARDNGFDEKELFVYLTLILDDLDKLKELNSLVVNKVAEDIAIETTKLLK